MSEFELLDTAGDISGKLRLIYGSGPTDPAPFVLTLTRKLRLSDFSCPDLVEDRSGHCSKICKLRVMNFVCARVEVQCGLAHRASSRLSFRRSNEPDQGGKR